ncbi:hypothetical protein HanXRQr2_Chr12g0521031 [Helianthus annuus]|uniref:G-protein gamma-like domain-containing protein n=1 Tax=Helianthus annuus TaxID=4232 RepID=A0A251SZ43_HELAN|nr:guanine nucleotide-binding protein subunit gamma 3 isoform X1 [Helianthus annuus]KAF5776148.1 hypothetical protein HanXRQr2_Chr12g0521031 [Helianthus annuus]KAJ0491195.1 hypothetical protein HanIR_Chr12g0561261 [Helianthus annuus]KAJ0861047.1 hypothetical protein HanPSC8_Chr12g0502321 [Helianthus annuus]
MEGGPRPKSPPGGGGGGGKRRRELAILETQIRFFQEELKSIETLKPASCCIKEVADYVVTNPEPLITLSRRKKTRKSCGFWKWLCSFKMSCLCCCCCRWNDCSGVTLPSSCCSLPECCSCSLPKCKSPGCPSCWCSGCSCPKCTCCWPAKCCRPKCSTCGCCGLQNSCCCCSASSCQCCCCCC